MNKEKTNKQTYIPIVLHKSGDLCTGFICGR